VGLRSRPTWLELRDTLRRALCPVPNALEWVQLDPSGLVSERDENNNLIPLNILGSRGAGC